MNVQIAPYTFQSHLRIPTPVDAFLGTLREFGTITKVSDNPSAGVALRLHAATVDDAETVGRRIAARLNEQIIIPAFPDRHVGGDWMRVPTYRWIFDTPTCVGECQWALAVPLTSDLLHLLDTVTGLGSWDRTYTGGPLLPVEVSGENREDVNESVREIEMDLYSWFGERAVLAPRD